MKNFFDAVHPDIEAAALVDGCSRLESFYRVVLPLSRPGLAATAVYAGILAWGDFLFARTLITNSNNWTMPIGVQSFVTEYTISWNELMAAGLISIIPVLLLFVFLEPFLTGGLTKGSID
jgi:multiple sugar transport system permease protein